MTNIEQLKKIYNTLAMVETKGNSTLIMADCVRALMEVITEMEAKENG